MIHYFVRDTKSYLCYFKTACEDPLYEGEKGTMKPEEVNCPECRKNDAWITAEIFRRWPELTPEQKARAAQWGFAQRQLGTQDISPKLYDALMNHGLDFNAETFLAPQGLLGALKQASDAIFNYQDLLAELARKPEFLGK